MGSLENPALSPGPAFHPESFCCAPEAQRGPPEAENGRKPPAPMFFLQRRDHVWDAHSTIHAPSGRGVLR
eukprot:7669218-Pyramimonas_sp.AAC.1